MQEGPIVIDLTVASEMDEEIAPQEAKPGDPLRRPCAISRRLQRVEVLSRSPYHPRAVREVSGRCPGNAARDAAERPWQAAGDRTRPQQAATDRSGGR